MTIREKIEALEAHTYQVGKLGRVKNEVHGYLCGETVDALITIIDEAIQQEVDKAVARVKEKK
jgi:hypothetical protein